MVGFNIFATAAFWNNSLYIAGATEDGNGGPLKHYSFDTTTEQFAAASQTSLPYYNFPGPTPSVSSNGTVQGIVWALDNSMYCTPVITRVAARRCFMPTTRAISPRSCGIALRRRVTRRETPSNSRYLPSLTARCTWAPARNNTGGSFGSTSVSGELEVYGLKPN